MVKPVLQKAEAIGSIPPAVTIRLPLEGRPHVYVDALTEGEEARLTDWLERRPEYADLIARAFELAEASV